MFFGDRLRQERLRRQLSQEALAEALGVSPRSILRWEQGRAIPQFSARLLLSRFFNQSIDELFGDDALPTSLTLWRVPYPRNPFFTGRQEVLLHLYEQFHQQHTMALTQSCAVTGLGGIGKTQIALEYAYRYRQDYHAVFWTNAATREILLDEIVAIADHLGLPERSQQDQDVVLRAVKRWFSTHQNWLWILDNADDLAMVQEVIPFDHSGHVLLTTRAQALGTLAQRIDVEMMGMVEGTLFLLRRARLLASDAFLDQVSEDQLAAAEALVLEMDFLPLALDQAGAYLEEVGCSLSVYCDLYQSNRRELLQRRGHLAAAHPESVATTWSLSFQKIEQANPVAARLLQLCAFLDPDLIPEEFFSDGGAYLNLTPDFAPLSLFSLNEAIEELRKFSLVQRNPHTGTLGVHRLVQAVIKDAMSREDQHLRAVQAVRATSAVFPARVEMTTLPDCRHYLSLAQACSLLMRDYALVLEEGASLLVRTALYLRICALYGLAEPLFQDALRLQEQLFGTDHPIVATTVSYLADIKREQNNFEQGEALFLRALAIQERMLGKEHTDVALSLRGLADLYRMQEKNAQAEPLYQRALQIWETTPEPDHSTIAWTLNGLALLYYRLGKYDDAERLHLHTLSILEQTLGPDHMDLASSLNGLIVLYDKQQRYSEAEPLHRRVLTILENTLGPEHPLVARQLHNLAEIYFGWQQNYSEAEALYQRALRIWEGAWGMDNSYVSFPLQGIANVYREQKMYAQADALYQRALRIREQSQGLWHPYTASLLLDMAALREAQGEKQQALALYQQVLTIQEKCLGTSHPEFVISEKRYHALLQTMELPDTII